MQVTTIEPYGVIERLSILKECANAGGRANDVYDYIDQLDISSVYNPGKIIWSVCNDSGVRSYAPRPKQSRTVGGKIYRPVVAAFDIDWTMTFSENLLFPKGPSDIHIMAHRKETVTKLFKAGYIIAFFTNQNAPRGTGLEKRLTRIAEFISTLRIPCYVYVATDKNKSGWKGSAGAAMWQMLNDELGSQPAAGSFYVGDAWGRPEDFSDSDRLFAEAAGIRGYTPEEVFPYTVVTPARGDKQMVVFVGAPGSGKSSYYKRHFGPASGFSFAHIEKETNPKMMRAVRDAIKADDNMVIDATNPVRADREVYYDMARQAGYNVTVLYFVRDGYGWNKLRVKGKVPDMVYHIYFKKLETPLGDSVAASGGVHMITAVDEVVEEVVDPETAPSEAREAREAPSEAREAPATTVVNVKVAHIRPKYDTLKDWMADPSHVYVARGGVVFIKKDDETKERFPKRDSPWHNPFKIGKGGVGPTREEVVKMYREYIQKKIADGELDISELRGKTLGCWCYPEACHADVLAELADAPRVV